MKRITQNYFVVCTMLAFGLAHSQTARIQVIHNAADAAAEVVDVYVNDDLLLDDFAFRTATPFVTVPAGVSLEIDVAPDNSSTSAEAIYTLDVTLDADGVYIIVANGIVSMSGYSPTPPFELSVYPLGRESASIPTNTDLLINHGATDAPTVDIVESSIVNATIVDDISYPSFSSGYLEVPTADYTLQVTDATGMTVVATYLAPLETLGLQGQSVTVLASGFLDPANNSDGPAFGLYAALATGGDLIALPAVLMARAQIIHNSADAAASTVDVYVNDVLAIDDFAFRTATPFIDLPAGESISIDVAPSGSTTSSESIYNLTTTLTNGETYIIVANGIVSPTGYSPSPAFELSVFAGARENALSPTNTDILVNHGSSDAPTVDIVETSVPAGTIVDDITYPSFSEGYLELPTSDYTINVNNASSTVGVAAYQAPLQTLMLQGQALTVLASGFLDPSQNSDGPAFGLWAALASGGDLVELPSAPLGINEIDASRIAIYPNPVSSVLNIEIPDSYNIAGISISDVSGRQILTQNNTASQINVSGLSAGVYILKIDMDKQSVIKKFMVAN